MKVCGGDDGIGRSDSVTAKVVAAVNKCGSLKYQCASVFLLRSSTVHGRSRSDVNMMIESHSFDGSFGLLPE